MAEDADKVYIGKVLLGKISASFTSVKKDCLGPSRVLEYVTITYVKRL